MMLPDSVVMPLLSSREFAQNEERKRAMMDLLVSEEAVLVIGAGCSVRLQYPSWPALLSKLAALANEIAADSGADFTPDIIQSRKDPLQYAGSIKTFIQTCDGSLNRYYGLLSGEFRQRELDPFHLQLVKIPSRGILTTNYDPSLDVALEMTDRSMTTADRFLIIENGSARLVSEFLASLNRGSGIPRRIAHLHGRYNQPQSIILADADYVEKYQSRLSAAERGAIRNLFADGVASQPRAISVEGLIERLESSVPPWSLHRKLLWSILATRRVVFIGFSLSDPYLAQMLALVADDLWRWKEAHHFAIMALPDLDTTETKLQAEFFQRKYAVGVVFYENRAAQHHQGLASIVDEIAVACGVAPEPKLEVQPESPAVLHRTAASRPEWIGRINRIMKQRATKDAG